MEVLVVMYLLVLHTPAGNEVTLNAKRIASMRQSEHAGDYVTKEVGCMINTDDGKFVSVIEDCSEVRRMIEVLEKSDAQ
jgi:hypothetical protein